MSEDIRAALEAAVRATPDPDARLQRWLAAVPRYVAVASGPGRGLSRTLAASLAACLMLGLGGSSLGVHPSRHVAPPQPHIVIVASNACPAGEKRYDEETAGYHTCMPSDWTSRVMSRAAAGNGYLSVIGFGDPHALDARARLDSEASVAPLVITVTQQPLVQASELEQLSEPRLITVASQLADEIQVMGGGRQTLLSRGDLLYSIQVSQESPESSLAYEEVLRTFTFRGLPYLADPEVRPGTG